MSSILTTTPEGVGDLVLKGIENSFQDMLAAKLQVYLQDYADSIVQNVAKECAENITARVVSYDNYLSDKIEVRVSFNIKEITNDSRKTVPSE